MYGESEHLLNTCELLVEECSPPMLFAGNKLRLQLRLVVNPHFKLRPKKKLYSIFGKMYRFQKGRFPNFRFFVFPCFKKKVATFLRPHKKY